MKKILSYIMTASLLVFLAGCAQEELVVSFGYDSEDERNLTLTLKFDEHDSRAVKTESELKENEITKVDLFLYPTNGTGAATVAKKALTPIVDENSTAEGVFIDDDGTVTVKIKVSSANISTLFPSGSGNKCTAYAIANGPAIGDNVTTSISVLKDMAITSNFDEVAFQTPGDGIQESFVMDGEGTITLSETNGKKSLSGDIALVRAAAKITLRVAEIVNDITEGGVKWRPEVNHMKVFFYNGVNASKLNATADDASSRFNLPFGANGIDGYTFASSTEGEGQNVKTVYNQEIPFYSYPSDWTNDADNEAYLVLLLPWKKDGAAQWTSFYYKIPISHVLTENGTTTSFSKLDRNTHYQIDVTVGILGAEEDKGEVILTPKYTLLDWGTQTVNATLDKAHYLVVDKKDVKVYNQNQVEIGYKASEDISVEITKIEREDLSGNTVGTTTFFPKTGETSAQTVDSGRKDNANKYTFMKACSVNKNNKSIILSHNIVNEDEDENTNADGYQGSGDDYDFTPYYITLRVTMSYTDGNDRSNTMTEEIQIIQYPAIYAVANKNSDYGEPGENTSTNHKDWNDRHNVFVNSYYTNGGMNSNDYRSDFGTPGEDFDIFGSVTGLNSSFGNTNPNMYVIYATSMSSTSNYIIGDPRETEAYDFQNSSVAWATAPALNSTSYRTLSDYYRTDDGEQTRNMIAPVFRIASSYSVTSEVNTHLKAEKRCASYQEDGYPAGRWRMPTYAEVEFICRLSSEKKIPALFYAGGSVYYWCAHGEFAPDGNGGIIISSNKAETVRCVYDEWYWGSEKAALIKTDGNDSFTWGDAPRTTTSN